MLPSLSNYPQKTYSQKIARAFEIIDYFLLLPALIGAIFPVLAVGGGLYRNDPAAFSYGLLMLGFIGFGFVLMAGYFRHSRGRLGEKWFSALWLSTAVYNSIAMLPPLYWLASEYQRTTLLFDGSGGGFIFLHIAVAAYATAIVYSLRAYKYDKFRRAGII